MISNKYGFIFIHTPKTGGTSINFTLHQDIDEECELFYEEKKGITHMFPSSKDFPWWVAWYDYHLTLGNTAYAQNESIFLLPQTADSIFMHHESGMGGNLKHMTVTHWALLFEDKRTAHYGSFREHYEIVGACRNPYDREFSFFLYTFHDELLDKTQSLKKSSEIYDVINTEWRKWALKELPSAYQQGSKPFSGSPSQCVYLIRQDSDGNLRGPTLKIRYENIDEDYDKACTALGIKRKTHKLPHLINTRKLWKKHLPHDIMELYDDELLEIIHEHRRFDFELLGYKKRT